MVQTFIGAPARRAWEALQGRTDLLFDGLPATAWPAVENAQEPVHFESPWPFTPAPTRVGVTLHDVGGGVRVDVRHEGWGEGPGWDDAIQGHFAGWLQGLAALGLLLETGKDARESGKSGESGKLGESGKSGDSRYFISGEIPAAPEAVYRSLTDGDVLGRWSGDAFGTAPVAEYGVKDRAASVRWPAVFERLATFLG